MSAPAPLPSAWTAGGIIRASAYDAWSPQPNPADPMLASPGGPHYDPDKTLLCPRGRHRLVGDNDYDKKGRCKECKNEDGRKYDLKRYGPGAKGFKTMAVPAAPAASPIITSTAPSVPKIDRVAAAAAMGYISRDLAGTPDVDALAKLRDGGLFAMLYGPPGTGKTAMVKAAFPDMLVINGDCDTTTDHFVGQWEPTGNPDAPYMWADGPLATCLRLGIPLFVDDATLIPAPVLALLYPVMDGNDFVIVKSHPVPDEHGKLVSERIEAAPGFYVIAAMNPGAYGSFYPEAFKSRFSLHVEVTTDWSVAGKLKVDPRFIKLGKNLNTMLRDEKISAAPQLREAKAYLAIQQTLGDDAALRNYYGTVHPDDRPHVLDAIKSTYSITKVEPLGLGTRP